MARITRGVVDAYKIREQRDAEYTAKLAEADARCRKVHAGFPRLSASIACQIVGDYVIYFLPVGKKFYVLGPHKKSAEQGQTYTSLIGAEKEAHEALRAIRVPGHGLRVAFRIPRDPAKPNEDWQWVAGTIIDMDQPVGAWGSRLRISASNGVLHEVRAGDVRFVHGDLPNMVADLNFHIEREISTRRGMRELEPRLHALHNFFTNADEKTIKKLAARQRTGKPLKRRK